MKKRLLKLVKIGTVVFAILLAVLLAVIIWSEYDNAVVVKYVRNENLPTIKADWKGTPVDQKNRFVNHEFPFLPSTVELLRWQLGRNPFKEEKLQDTSRL